MNPYTLLAIAVILLFIGATVLIFRPRKKVMPKSCCTIPAPPIHITSTHRVSPRSVGGSYQSPPRSTATSPTPDDQPNLLATGVVLGSMLGRDPDPAPATSSHYGRYLTPDSAPVLESPEPTKHYEPAPVYESPSIPDSSPMSIPDSSPMPDVTVDTSSIC
jgi:hypothetical protein